MPRSTDVLAYKTQLEESGYRYKEPLSAQLYDPLYINTQFSWDIRQAGVYDDVLPEFKVPEIFAVSGNCVESQFNPNPVHPRLYAPKDQETQVIKYCSHKLLINYI